MKRAVFLLALAAAACDPEPVPRPGKRAGTRGDPFGAVETAPVTSAALGYRQARALVVGISRYSSPSLGALDGTVFDAEEVAALLASRYGVKTTLLTDRDGPPLTRARLLEALGDLKKDVGRDDALLFFYAGHGVPGRLVPADAEPAKEPSAWKNLLTFAELGAALRACDAHHTLVVLDSCFSGSALAENSSLKEAVGTLGDPSLRVAEADNLARVFNRRSFQVLTAGTGAEEVEDLAKLSRDYAGLGKDLEKHSPFTGVLLQALRGLTGRPDGRVPASDLGYYLKHTLVNENAAFKARQAPQFGALGGGDGDFLFLPVQRVLNPRLVAPLYMPGAEYAELRTSAAAALAEFVEKADPKDREELARGAVPHLARVLRDEKAGPRKAAAEAIRRLAPLSGEFARCVPVLSEILAGQAQDDEQDVAAEALGALAAHADDAAWGAMSDYTERQRARFFAKLKAEKLDDRPWPQEFYDRYGVVKPDAEKPRSPAEGVKAVERYRAVNAWSLTGGLELLRRLDRLHQEGLATLEKAEKARLEKSFYETHRLLRAASPLLWPKSEEWSRAINLERSTPDLRPLWRLSPNAHHEKHVQRMAASADGRRLATWGEEGTVRWWNAKTGALEGELPQAAHRMVGMALSVDGRRLIWLTWMGAVERWDLEKKVKLAETRMLREARGFAALDDEAKRIAVGMFDSVIGLIDPAEPQKALYLRDAGRVNSRLAVHRALGTLVSYGGDGYVSLWSLEKGTLIRKIPALPEGETDVEGLVVHEAREEAIWICEKGALCSASLKGDQDARGLASFKGEPNALALSPDGGALVVGSGDFGVQLLRYPELKASWTNASTIPVEVGAYRALSARKLTKVASPVFSPDGRRLWMARRSEIVDADVSGGLGKADGIFRGRLAHASYSPDGRRFVTAGARLLFWADGEPRAIDHDGRAGSAAWIFPDGRRALAVLDGLLISLEIDSEKIRWKRALAAGAQVRMSRDGREVVVAEGRRLFVLDGATGSVLRELGATMDILALGLHPGGTFAALGTWRSTVALVDLADGRELWRRQAGKAVVGGTSALSFNPQGAFLAAGDEDGDVRVWYVCTGEEFRGLSASDLGSVRDLAWSPDGRLLAAAGEHVRVWDVRDKADAMRFSPAAPGTVSASFSPDGRSILAVGLDGSLSLWSLGVGSESVRLPAPPDGVTRIEMSPVGDVYAATRQTGIYLCSSRTGEVLAMLPGDGADDLAFSADGKRLSAVWGGALKVYDIPGAKVIFEAPAKFGFLAPDGERVLTLQDHQGKVLGLDGKERGAFQGLIGPRLRRGAFVRGGVLSGDDTGEVLFWSAETGKTRSVSPATGDGVEFLRASPDARRAVVVDAAGRSTLYDFEQNKRRPTGPARRGSLSSLDFSPDGRMLLYAWFDGAVCVWDLEKEEVVTWMRTGSTMPRVRFHPDGRRLFSSGRGHEIHIYDLKGSDTAPELPRLSTSLLDVETLPSLPRVTLEEQALQVRDLDALLLVDGELEAPLKRLLGSRLAASGEDLLRAGRLEAAKARFAQAKARGADVAGFEATLAAIAAAKAGRWAEVEPALEKAEGIDPDRLFLLKLVAARRRKDVAREKALWASYETRRNSACREVARVAKGETTLTEALAEGPWSGDWPLEGQGVMHAWFALLGMEGHAEEARRLLKAESLELELLRP